MDYFQAPHDSKCCAEATANYDPDGTVGALNISSVLQSKLQQSSRLSFQNNKLQITRVQSNHCVFIPYYLVHSQNYKWGHLS